MAECSGDYYQYLDVCFHVEKDLDLSSGDAYYDFYESMFNAACECTELDEEVSGTFVADDFSWVLGKDRIDFTKMKSLKAGEPYWFSIGNEYYMRGYCTYDPGDYWTPESYYDFEVDRGGILDFDVKKFESMIPGVKVDKFKISDPEQ